jgi:hypothetical protein
MRRILLDENMPVGVRNQLPGFVVATVPEMGWAGLSNGDLLAAAEQAGFEVLVTGDKNIPHQLTLTKSKLAVVILGTTHWPTIRANPQPVREAVERTAPASYVVVPFSRPKLRRRPPSPRNSAG